MTNTLRLAVAGAGLIGARHIAAISRVAGVELAALIDPAPFAEDLAQSHGAAWFADLNAAMDASALDGVVLATPNQAHAAGAEKAIAAGLPVLVEKPITDSVDSATALVAQAEAAGVALLVGHHRRHLPLIAAAREIVSSGQLGQLVSIHAQVWLSKPDPYFNVAWRRARGAGPVYLNLIHDIDLLQALCGPVTSVHAMESNAIRGNAVEDTAVVLLRFESGLLGTVNVTDAAAAPWSWELTAGENPAYPKTDESAYMIGGKAASLSIPDLSIWRHTGDQGWCSPISRTRHPIENADALERQIAHFARVIRGQERPLVSGADGLAALRVIEAVKASAATGETVAL